MRNRGYGVVLGNNSNNAATATFVVPADYVAGQSIPKLNIYWAGDDASDRRVDCDVSFAKITDMTSPSTSVPFRYNFRSSSGASTNAMESNNPAQGAITTQMLPEGAEVYDGSPASWVAGDIIIITIGRNGGSGSDPSGGNMYIYGISFDYDSDM